MVLTMERGRSAVRVRSTVRACLRSNSSADIRLPETPIDSRKCSLSPVKDRDAVFSARGGDVEQFLGEPVAGNNSLVHAFALAFLGRNGNSRD